MIKIIKVSKWFHYIYIIILICFFLGGIIQFIYDITYPKIVSVLYAVYFIVSYYYFQYIIEGKKIKLYEISEYIEVSGSRVVIDKLPKEYKYVNENISKYNPQIFKLEYDEFFEKATLINDKNEVLKLTKEDYEFLESINKESGVH